MTLPEGPGIRNDIGVHSESTVSPFYDPMIAKLIVKGKSRNEAVERLHNALSAYEVEGIKTNIPLLLKIAESPEFQEGDTATDFIEKHIRKQKSNQ